MDREEVARELINRIYAAAMDASLWTRFAEGLAEAIGGAGVSVYLSMQEPNQEPLYFRGGYESDRTPRFKERFVMDNPWRAPELAAAACQGFVCTRGFISDEAVRSSEFYRDQMQSLRLGTGTIIAIFAGSGAAPAAALIIYPLEGREPLGEDDAAFGNLLFPHLQRAYQIFRSLAGVKHEAGAMADVIHRLPAGVVFLDAQRRPVLVNPNAQRLMEVRDGFVVDERGPRLSYAHEDEPFQKAVSEAIEAGVVGRPTDDRVLVASRPSGRQPLLVIVTRLLEPALGCPTQSAVAAVFIGNATPNRPVPSELLMRLYSLTRAEAELVALLCDGLTLEGAAERRGVTVNTARWQLKQVFSKTGARSQSALIRLVLSGTAPLTEG
jgi:DNA-binding CsgD family transcriptional regulator